MAAALVSVLLPYPIGIEFIVERGALVEDKVEIRQKATAKRIRERGGRGFKQVIHRVVFAEIKTKLIKKVPKDQSIRICLQGNAILWGNRESSLKSSAYNIQGQVNIEGRSLIKNKNKGPRMDPCSTPRGLKDLKAG